MQGCDPVDRGKKMVQKQWLKLPLTRAATRGICNTIQDVSQVTTQQDEAKLDTILSWPLPVYHKGKRTIWQRMERGFSTAMLRRPSGIHLSVPITGNLVIGTDRGPEPHA